MSFPQALHRLQHLKYLTSSSLAVVGDDDDGEGDASRGIVDGGCDVSGSVERQRRCRRGRRRRGFSDCGKNGRVAQRESRSTGANSALECYHIVLGA